MKRKNEDYSSLWYAWYTSKVSGVHSKRYEDVNGISVLCNLLSVNLPKLMVRHTTDYVLNEMEVSKEVARDFEAVFGDISDISKIVEIGLVFGKYSLFTEEVTTGERNIHILSPLDYSYNDGAWKLNINSFDVTIKKKEEVYEITYHNRLNNEDTVKEELLNPIKEQLFNNDYQFQNGKSLFADSIDALKSLDFTYTEMWNTLELGRNMVIASPEALRKDIITDATSGETERREYLKRNSRIFKYVASPFTENGSTAPIQHIQGDLKINEFEQAINLHIQVATKNAGFDNGFFRYSVSQGITATAVITSKSDMYTLIKKYQRKLRENLLEYFNEYFYMENNREMKEEDITFGDGLITNEEATKDKGDYLYSIGVISRDFLLREYYNFTDAEIKESKPEDEVDPMTLGG